MINENISKPFWIVVTAISMSILLLFYFTSDIPSILVDKKNARPNEEKNGMMEPKRIKSNQKNEISKERHGEQGKANQISFEDYKKFIRNAAEKPAFRKPYCNKKYGLLELVFLSRTSSGELKPKNVHMYDLELKSSVDCLSEFGHSGRNFRYYVNVSEHCTDCISVAPGEVYTFKSLGKETNIDTDYKIRVPPAEELTFKREFDLEGFQGNKEDPVHRVPVIVDEVFKTNKEQLSIEDHWTSNELAITGVPKHLTEEPGAELKYHYHFNGTIHRTVQRSRAGTWELDVITKKKDNISTILGGTLIIYKSLDKRTEKIKSPFVQLVGYKKNVQSNPFSLNSSGFIDYLDKSWREKTIDVESILKEKIPQELSNLRSEQMVQKGILLQLKGGEFNGDIYVCASKIHRKRGTYKVTLNAPPGTYKLKMDKMVLEENFSWPPKD